MNSPRWTGRFAGIAVLLLLWAALALWQWEEYRHEKRTADHSLQLQAETVRRVLVGSLLSHRRVGPFFESMVQGGLDELARSEAVLAVGIAGGGRETTNGQPSLLLSAGRTELLDTTGPIEDGAVRFVQPFVLGVEAEGDVPGSGGGRGGRGWGRGARRPNQSESGSLFQPGGQYLTILVLDRSQADERAVRAFWLRLWVVAAGGLVLVCLTAAWWVTVRLVQARGRARVLESQARHLREMSQAAAGLAHETRNPLGLVRGWTQRLAQSALDSPRQQRQARAVIEECDRVTARINQFLSFARPCQPKPDDVDLEELARQLAVILEPDLEAQQLRLKITTEGHPTTARVDRELFRQALFNLLTNAIQFSPPGATVEILLNRRQDGRWRIEVADAGPGVEEHHVDSLFSPYFTTRSGGTGLGLAIVRRIATTHGWRAGYRPRPGGGSVFWLDQADGR